jgi:uncharacterized membrane protein
MKSGGKIKKSLAFMSIFYILAGTLHFVMPKFYMKMMPSYIPFHHELIYVSGLAEIILGFGLLNHNFMRLSAWGIIALLVAVFPANVYAYTDKVDLGVPQWVLLVRIPLQGVLIYWAYLYAKRNSTPYHFLPLDNSAGGM